MLVLIVEDDPETLDTLAGSFRQNEFVVDTANDGVTAVKKITLNEYDLVVLDIGLPEKNGWEVCKEVRVIGKMTPVIILSVQGEIDVKVGLLNSGADDFLTKPFSFEELLARARALLRRPEGLQGDIFRVFDIVLDTAARRVSCGAKDVHLTPKEFVLLEYLMRNQGVALSRQMLLEHVWDVNADPFTNTVETHVLTLRKKIGDRKGRVIHTVPNV